MEPQRYLRCLGQPALLSPSGEPVRFRTRKHLALLVYIAVEGRSHRRDRLAELLWPNVSPTEARHSLATALSVLRPRLGLDALETSRDHVRLVPRNVGLDLDRLQSGDVLGSEVTPPLEVAGFLEGFDITDSTEFAHWKDRQQARLLPVIKDALLVLIDRCRRTGDTRQIEQLADRMLALDELCEDAIRAKMEARAFAGDRLTALEIFEAWKKKLAEELQAVPTDLVEGMAVRLRRRGWERTTLANVPNVPTDQWRGRPFIGRTVEYKMLYELWEGVRKGLGGHALVLGDSGVGKTTLVQRLTTAAGLEGAVVSRVQCYDLERDIPYSTLSGIITGLLDCPGVAATPPEALAELSRTMPQIRQRFTNLPASAESQGETARIRLTEAFSQMLVAIAEEHPIILVVDDLHLADDVSVAVLHMIMRRTCGKPILVVLVARPGELSESVSALRLRESSQTLGISEVDVLPLTDAESRAMLGSLVPSDCQQPDVREQRALIRAAAGFPMVLELLVQDWQTHRERSLALSIDAMTSDVTTAGALAQAYSHILTRIAHSLDSTTQNVLNLAAILGHRMHNLDMYALVDLTVGQTMTGMAQLVVLRVLRDGPQGLEFVNELVRAAAYVAVPTSLRRVLHSQIADRLISERRDGDDDLGLAVAWHCIRASRTDEATGYLLAGARHSMRKGAVHAAERALSSALPHLRGTEREEATLLLIEALQEQGRWLESLDLLRQSSLDHNPLVMVLSFLAECRSTFLCVEDLRSKITQILNVIHSSHDVSVRIKASTVGTVLVNMIRDQEAARDLLSCVESIPLASLTMEDSASIANSKTRLIYISTDRAPDFPQIVAIAAELQRKRYVNSTMGSLHSGIGMIACCRGRYAEAKSDFLQAHDIYVSLGNEISCAHQAAQIALCCFRLGEYSDAIEWSLSALSNIGQEFEGYMECQGRLYSGASYALLGDSVKALEAIQHLDLRMAPSAPSWTRQAWGLHKADVLLLLGRLSEAVDVALTAIGPGCAVLHSAFFAGPFARWIALTSRVLGRTSEVELQLAAMLEQLDRYDAIDQVEILCAGRILPRLRASDFHKALIENRLTQLPAAVAEQLTRLRMLAWKPLPELISV
jgi:DNA-binding SARP family transcriptional activator/tetratricopeptide (TPR) repeat protein/type II secretory pathway predicted ATPase ExeA